MFIFAFVSTPSVTAPPSWYDPSWTKRKPITIDNTLSQVPVGIWSDKAPLPLRLSDASSAIIDGKIYIFGGYGPGGAGDVRSEVYAYDPTTDSWTQKASMPGGHSYAAGACALGTKAYVFGGISSGGSYLQDTLHLRFDCRLLVIRRRLSSHDQDSTAHL